MDFTISEDLRMMRETIRKFVEKDLEPISRQVEEEGRIPEEYGGLGLSTLTKFSYTKS